MESNGNKQSEGICVAIRMRPLNEREVNSGQEKIFKCQTDRNAVCQTYRDSDQPVEGQVYHYDKVFDESSSTDDVYSYIGSNLVKGVMSGMNATIFACKLQED